eukprot:7741373-Alexandrium_andersonii.AAC.1
MLHSWELPCGGSSASSSTALPAAGGPPSDLTPLGGWHWEDGSDEEQDAAKFEPTKDEASAEFANMLVDMHLKRGINAKETCQLA